MALSDLDRRRIEQLLTLFCDRIPNHVRDRVRNGFRLEGSVVELFEERPAWDGRPAWIEHAVARFRFVASRKLWLLYCQHRDLKWHAYERLPSAGTFEILLDEVKRDPTGIFWG